MNPTYAAWQVEDADGRILHESKLGAADFAAGDLDSLVAHARTEWKTAAAAAGVSATEGLSVRFSVTTFESGTCGELRVFARVQ